MKSLFLVLVFVNLLVFASQFDAVQGLVGLSKPAPRPAQLSAERLRIVRDTSARARPADNPDSTPTSVAGAPPQPPSGTNSR